jgi:hypothetical protein
LAQKIYFLVAESQNFSTAHKEYYMKPVISKVALLEAISQLLGQYDLSQALELREGKNDKMFAYGFAVAPKQTLTFEGETLSSRQVQVAITFQDVKTLEFAVRETPEKTKAATISLADLRARLSATAK